MVYLGHTVESVCLESQNLASVVLIPLRVICGWGSDANWPSLAPIAAEPLSDSCSFLPLPLPLYGNNPCCPSHLPLMHHNSLFGLSHCSWSNALLPRQIGPKIQSRAWTLHSVKTCQQNFLVIVGTEWNPWGWLVLGSLWPRCTRCTWCNLVFPYLASPLKGVQNMEIDQQVEKIKRIPFLLRSNHLSRWL